MSETRNSKVYSILTEMFPRGADLHTPSLDDREKIKVCECLDSTFVSSVGPMTGEVENRLADMTGAQHVAVTSNGTSALHLCLHALGVGPGDLIIVPAITFVATANAVLYTGAQCLFVDVEPVRFGIDPVKLAGFLRAQCHVDRVNNLCIYKKTGQPIRAIIPVHLFGIPARIEEIVEVCKEFQLRCIEDAAEALGSTVAGRHVGTFGDAAAISFNGNKIITAGGGGATLCNDPELSRKIKHLSTTAKVPSEYRFHHDMLGFNYRMPNLNAALLLAQLDKFDTLLAQKRLVHERYVEAFAGCEEGQVQRCPVESICSNYWLNNFILSADLKGLHSQLIRDLNQAQVRVRPVWDLLQSLPYLAAEPRMEDLSTAEEFSSRIISLPSSAHLAATLA